MTKTKLYHSNNNGKVVKKKKNCKAMYVHLKSNTLSVLYKKKKEVKYKLYSKSIKHL